MKVLLAYFSATGYTARIAKEIKGELNNLDVNVDELDITSYTDRQEKVDLNPYDAIIFGFPVHSLRAPRLGREWLQTLDGNGKKCATFFTYGGFTVEPVHYTTRKILEEHNFILVSSAEFLSAHTFNLGGWKAMIGRPNQADFTVAREYTEKTYRRFSGEDSDILPEFDRPVFSDKELDDFEQFRFKVVTNPPNRGNTECCMCGLCEELCPAQAMNSETGIADRDKCIVCFRCVDICPEGVLQINDLSNFWSQKLSVHGLTEEEMQQQESRIFL